jgi:prepilin-type N-terminal cleavage/methylation domain-containing protein
MKLQQLRKKSQGFTIIEVLIVLAIAGLILLIVFLAVPALQRNSRNNSRKNDVQNVLGGISEHVNNNNGQLPATGAPGVTLILANVKVGTYADTDIIYVSNNTTPQAAIGAKVSGKMYVSNYAKCNTAADQDFAAAGGTSRSIAILYEVEQSASTVWKCVES